MGVRSPGFPGVFRDGLTPNFGGVNIGFGDQKILSDLGMVDGISEEIPNDWGKIPLSNGLKIRIFYLRGAPSVSDSSESGTVS